MSKGSSSSETSQSTSSADNRIGADNGAIVISGGGSYNNSFSPDVAHTVSDVIGRVLDFSGGVVNAAGSIINESSAGEHQIASAALAQSNQVANNAQLGQSSLFTNPATLAAIVAVVGLFIYLSMKKR